MEITGEELIKMAERCGLFVTGWQREKILREAPYLWNADEPVRLWPEPREPVQTRRVQRRRQTRAERIRARQRPQPGYFVIIDELPGQP